MVLLSDHLIWAAWSATELALHEQSTTAQKADKALRVSYKNDWTVARHLICYWSSCTISAGLLCKQLS